MDAKEKNGVWDIQECYVSYALQLKIYDYNLEY